MVALTPWNGSVPVAGRGDHEQVLCVLLDEHRLGFAGRFVERHDLTEVSFPRLPVPATQ